jgi:predicted ATPase
MIKEIYIDNFKCLSDFRIKPKEFQLWLGDNGTGKTSVFEVLRNLQLLLQGKHLEDIFKASSRTAWDQRTRQTIGVSMILNDESYDYNLTIEYADDLRKARIEREELKWKGSIFYFFDGREAHLYRVNQSTQQPEEGTSFPADWSRSAIHTIAERQDNQPLLRFREAVFSWLLIHPIPHVVKQEAETETRILEEHAENFAEWYRYVLQEEPGIGYKAKEMLKDVLPGFDQVKMREAGDVRRVTAVFRINDKDREFDFSTLSDGQQQLIVLYTILAALESGVFSTLFIDEPDNFVSLREIQPWLGGLQDICEEEGKQAIIVSHHPEIINKMARGDELWFSRPEGAQVVTRSMSPVADLTPADIIARGWENE